MIVKLRLLGSDEEVERVLAVLRMAAGVTVTDTGSRSGHPIGRPW